MDLAAQRIWMGNEVFQEVPFDRAKWLSYERYKHQNIRKRMYHDLVARHLKAGMIRRNVRELLGKPEFVDGSNYQYHLGPDAAGMDTNELVIESDRSDRVIGFWWKAT